MESEEGSSTFKFAPVENETPECRSTSKEPLVCASTPKIQLLELVENIKAAEMEYDSVRMQWDLAKSLQRVGAFNESAPSQNSTSSLVSSLKPESPENSIEKEEPEDSQTGIDRVIVNPQEEVDPEREDSVSNLNLTGKDSGRSVRTTSKKGKKTRKQSLVSGFNEDPNLKTRLISAKMKKKKFRVKKSNSKSTITTRDSNFSEKKKKIRRQKSADTISASPMASRKKSRLPKNNAKQLNSREFVEIYHHNTSLINGDFSAVPGNESTNVVGDPPISRLRQESDQASGDGCETRNDFTDLKNYDRVPCFDLDLPNQEQGDAGPIEAQLHGHEGHTCAHQNCYDFFTQKNYEMPTMSSKMKRVHRSYFHQYNIRNIPFVVSTSLSPSHNLGLNIQQVLSIIKTRQPTIPGVSPLLIRKISQGIRPVSTLLEQINNNNGNVQSCRNLNGCNVPHDQDADYEDTSYKPQPNLSYEPLYKVDEETRSTCSDQGKLTFDRKPDQNAQRKSVQKYQSSKKPKKFSEAGCMVGSNATTVEECHDTSSNKEIAKVFTRLYGQFDKMISQHEKLKTEHENRKDKLLSKELAELEEAIEEKEEEITMVVNLYKEVMSLKHQMKLIHERNSFVCITTEDTSYYGASKIMPNQSRTNGPCPQNKANDAPNALRLAGLLKQIQAFQRQISVF